MSEKHDEIDDSIPLTCGHESKVMHGEQIGRYHHTWYVCVECGFQSGYSIQDVF